MSEHKLDLKSITNGVDIGIEAQHRREVAEALGQLLADEHVLLTKTRNYHWNVQGMAFGSLHELFEEQYNDLASSIDDIAERIRSLGFFAPGSMEEFLNNSRLVETDHLNGRDRDMISNLLKDHEAIIQILRHDIPQSEENNDVGTADFLTALMEDHEKMAWMLRAHLG